MQDATDPNLISTAHEPDELAREIETHRNRRFADDLYKRSLIGPLFYLIASVLTIQLSNFYQGRVWLLVIPTVIFLSLWWQRYTHRPPKPNSDQSLYIHWNKRQWLLIHLGACLWSAIAAVTGALEMQSNNAVILTMITTIAFSTAASHAFAMYPKQARWCVIEFILPPILVYIFFALELRAIGITLCIYLGYLMVNLHSNAEEYKTQIETEVRLIQSRAEVAQLSLTDSLTGLPNRRSYETTWNHVWWIAARQHGVLALIVIDLDFFKKINDKHGHLTGDLCLKHFSQVLRQHMRRESDLIARIGGEEFVVILPNTPVELAYIIAENLRSDLQQTPCLIDTLSVPFTASIGVGLADWAKDKIPADTFHRVDLACYQAKTKGRNLVVRS
ncbi:GGDEF domain-containing protein [Undibacterium sp. RuRC25W]|uniref:GGDEF domain-containing protein n=1 Tax=Undibacterium sp. RuRC25W TaxID=3413047 RepID=UPI003BF0AAA0